MKYLVRLATCLSALMLVSPTKAAQSGDIRLVAQIENEAFSIGDPVECAITLRNDASRPIQFFTETVDRKETGIRFNVIDAADGKSPIRQQYRYGDAVYPVASRAEKKITRDLTKLFDLSKPGRYKVRVSYGVYDHILRNKGRPDETIETSEILSVDSDWITFRIENNEEMKRRVKAIGHTFHSASKTDKKQHLEKLKTEDKSIVRALGDTILAVANGPDQPLAETATEVVLTRIQDLDIPDYKEGLHRSFQRTSRDKAVGVRLATALALQTQYGSWKNDKLWRSYMAKDLGKWIERESSDECRAILVSMLRGNIQEQLVEIIENDPSVEVKLSAVRRLVQLFPEAFMKSGVRLADRNDRIQIAGVDTTLGAFITSELERLKASYDADRLPSLDTKDVPETPVSQKLANKRDIVIVVKQDERIVVDGTTTSLDDFVGQVRKVTGDDKESIGKIRIVTPQGMERGKVREMMDKLTAAGYWRLSFETQESD